MTGYKNPDIFAQKDGVLIALRTDEYFEVEIARFIDRNHNNKNWTPIAMELRRAAIEELLRLFNTKLVEQEKAERLGVYRCQPQDKLYPELKEDLKNWYPV